MNGNSIARRALRHAVGAALVAGAFLAPLPAGVGSLSVARAQEEGVRTQRPRPPSAMQRAPSRVQEDSHSEPSRDPARRRPPPGYRPRQPDTVTSATVNLTLPAWTRDSIGLHPLRLSLNVQSGYQDYLKEPNPIVFVVSRRGRYANWRYCRPGGRCNAAAAARSALARCDRIGIDSPCYVFAVGRNQVWKGTVEKESSLGAAVLTASGTEHRGPQKAKGVIFYFRGYGAWRFPPNLSFRRVPPYVQRFARDGWDVKTVEVPYYNRPPRNLPRIVKLIHSVVAAARSQKYKKVVLAGQSRGAWEIISAANEPLPVDGIILVAPAAHGTRHLSNGRLNRNFNRGNPAFQALMGRLKAPRVAFVFFRRDPFMPASRAELARAALENRPGVSLFLVRLPQGLPGHNAGWSANFARAWGGCLEKFIAAPARPGAFACSPARFKIDTPELIYSSNHLFEHGASPIEPAKLKALLSGKRLYTAPEPNQEGWWDFGSDGRVTMHLQGAWMRPNPVRAHWETRGSRVCILGSPIHGGRVFCYTAYRVADNVLALMMKSRIVRLMYIR
ncbi:MAG: alpha/beta hydrolase [Bauldia litoralis]